MRPLGPLAATGSQLIKRGAQLTAAADPGERDLVSFRIDKVLAHARDRSCAVLCGHRICSSDGLFTCCDTSSWTLTPGARQPGPTCVGQLTSFSAQSP